MTDEINLREVGIFIGAIAAAVPIIGGFVLQVLDRLEKKHRDSAAERRELKLEDIAMKVDGLTERAVTMAVRAGTAEGRAIGVAEERADPQTPLNPDG